MSFSTSKYRLKSSYKFGSREACVRGGKRSQQVQEERRMQGPEPLRRPDAGTLLRTVTIVDHLLGTSVEVQVRQAERKNQVIPVVFGRVGKPVGWDKIVRRLRAICVCRWIEE